MRAHVNFPCIVTFIYISVFKHTHTKPVDVLYFPTPNNGSSFVLVVTAVENDDNRGVIVARCDGEFNINNDDGVDDDTTTRWFNAVRAVEAFVRHRFVTTLLMVVLHFNNCRIMVALST